ncbi:MAG TPA: ATP-binding protein [Candidatus Wallbacteria bacterium]|nr:ATP-binding protein [Candidatus Wallbacteria bacterium]
MIALSGLLIYMGLVITFQYVKGNVRENRSESIQFIATEVHDQIIELNLMDNLIKLQEFLSDYVESKEVSIHKIHVLNKNYEVVASSDIKYVRKKIYDEGYRQVKERMRSYIIDKKIDEESIVECAYPIKPSIFNSNKQAVTNGGILGILLVWKKNSPITELIYSDYSNLAVLIVFLIVLGIVIWIGFYTNRFFSSLGSISGAAKKIALGDLKERIPLAENSEFGLLAESFNQIADDLEGRIRETSVINKKLEESNSEKEKQVKILSQMAGGVAHEVRNPLGGIRGFAELLKSEIPPEDATKIKYIQYILDEVKTLESLVQNVLDFARPKKPNITSVNVEMLMDGVSNIIQNRVEEVKKNGPKIDFEYSFAENAAELDADFTQLRQVILNLALNSCDAMSDKGGKLRLDFEKADAAQLAAIFEIPGAKCAHYAKLTISDTGPGMSKDIMDNLFSPFYTTKASGTGLGLSICKKIVESHNGYIKIKSVQGSGTSFFIFLPFSQ